MKNKLTILIYLVSLIFIFSNTFIIKDIIITDDNRLSLKDFFPDITFDRTITFLNSKEIKYSKEQLTNLITPFLDIYYDEYYLKFESEDIIIKKELNISNVNYFDFKPFLNSFIQTKYPKLTVVNYENIPVETEADELQIVNSFLNKNNLFISLKYKTKNITKFSSVKVYVEKLESILFSKDIITIGETITSDNTYEATINVLQYNFKTYSKEEIIFGKFESTKIFKKDEPINKTYLKMIPDVKKGDVVNIFVNIGGIKIQTLGKVISDGIYGQNITVRNIETNKMISGILKQGPSVFINLGGEYY